MSQTGAKPQTQSSPAAERLKRLIQCLYCTGKTASQNQIQEIKTAGSKLPLVLVDFHDSATRKPQNGSKGEHAKKLDNFSIRAICREVLSLNQHKSGYKENAQGAKQFLSVLNGESSLSDQHPSLVHMFYNKVLKGIHFEVLQHMSQTVMTLEKPTEAVPINPNLALALSSYCSFVGVPKVYFGLLTLTAVQLLRPWTDKNVSQIIGDVRARGFDAEFVGSIGNEVVFDEHKLVSGVNEHVPDSQKGLFIADQTVFLADNRETQKRKNSGHLAVNIEVGHYNKTELQQACLLVDPAKF